MDFLLDSEIKCLKARNNCDLYLLTSLIDSEMGKKKATLLYKLDLYYLKYIRPKIEKVIVDKNSVNLIKLQLTNSCSYDDIDVNILCKYLKYKGFEVVDKEDYYNISWSRIIGFKF